MRKSGEGAPFVCLPLTITALQVRGKLTLRTRPGRHGGIAGLCIVKNNTLTIRAETRSPAATQTDDDELVLAVSCVFI